MKMNIRHCQAE